MRRTSTFDVVPGLPHVADRQDDDEPAFDAIARDIARCTERDEELPVVRLFRIDRPQPRKPRQRPHPVADRPECSCRGFGVFLGEEAIQAFEIGDRVRRIDYPGYFSGLFGAGFGRRVPSESIQPSSSACVAWRPVSS